MCGKKPCTSWNGKLISEPKVKDHYKGQAKKEEIKESGG
jgi:hypothetical protein